MGTPEKGSRDLAGMAGDGGSGRVRQTVPLLRSGRIDSVLQVITRDGLFSLTGSDLILPCVGPVLIG